MGEERKPEGYNIKEEQETYFQEDVKADNELEIAQRSMLTKA